MMQRSLSIAIMVCLMSLPLLAGCDDGAETQVSKSPASVAKAAPTRTTVEDSANAEVEDQSPQPTDLDSPSADQAASGRDPASTNTTAKPDTTGKPEEPSAGSADEESSPPPMRRPFRRPPPPNETAPPPQPRVVRPSSTGAASSGGVAEITFDTIKFDIEPGDPFEPEMLTEDIENLFGKKVRIRGYIYPPFQQTGIKQFVLVRDNMECCFGPGAALYDCVAVDMVDDKTIDYTVRPVAVEGTFRLNEVLGLGGEHLSIFHLDGVRVQ